MANKYSEIIQKILENWLDSLSNPENDEERLDDNLQNKIKTLVEQGDVGIESKVKSIFKEIGS
jgi:hypothetical protein